QVMAYSLGRLAGTLPPSRSTNVQEGDALGLVLLQVANEHRLEEVMVAVPLPLGVQANRKQMLADEPPADVARVGFLTHRGRQAGCEAAEDRRVDQEALEPRGLSMDHLLSEVLELRLREPPLGRQLAA